MTEKKYGFLNSPFGKVIKQVYNVEMKKRQKLIYGCLDIEQKLKDIEIKDKLEGYDFINHLTEE